MRDWLLLSSGGNRAKLASQIARYMLDRESIELDVGYAAIEPDTRSLPMYYLLKEILLDRGLELAIDEEPVELSQEELEGTRANLCMTRRHVERVRDLYPGMDQTAYVNTLGSYAEDLDIGGTEMGLEFTRSPHINAIVQSNCAIRLRDEVLNHERGFDLGFFGNFLMRQRNSALYAPFILSHREAERLDGLYITERDSGGSVDPRDRDGLRIVYEALVSNLFTAVDQAMQRDIRTGVAKEIA